MRCTQEGQARACYAASWYSWYQPAEQVTAADPAEVDLVASCLLVDRR
jgi:hypothetical protein